MKALTTNGIKVIVETRYQEEYSRPISNKYLFTYRITIENLGDETVQLLRRHWYIVDSVGDRREVEGEGVVGKQPVILPGDMHQYVSWCPLTSTIGKMWGTFEMSYADRKEKFNVQIPTFNLWADFVHN